MRLMNAQAPSSPNPRPAMLILSEELARLPHHPRLHNPDDFIGALMELSDLRSRKAGADHPSVPGASAPSATDLSNFSSSLREHAIQSLAAFAPPGALLDAARACERLDASAEAQSLFSATLARAASELNAELIKALIAAGARCESKYALGSLCEHGGAALLEDPSIREFFALGVDKDITQPSSNYSSKPSAALEYLSARALSQAPAALVERLVQSAAKAPPFLELLNLKAGMGVCSHIQLYYQKRNDTAYWSRRNRQGQGKCPQEFSEAEARTAHAHAQIFYRALRGRLDGLLNAAPGSGERLMGLGFMIHLVRKSPALFVSIASDRAADRFSLDELKHSSAEDNARLAEREPPKPAELEPRLSYFEIALCNGAAEPTLQATAERCERPNMGLIGELAKIHFRFQHDEKRLLWLQSLESQPRSRLHRPTARL